MYLKKNIIGSASRTVYGHSGDKVTVLGHQIEMVLVENKGERFFVFPEDLTENYFESYEKSNPVTPPTKEGTGRVQSLGKVKRRK